MKVLVDTSIWSLALRRNSDLDKKEVKELSGLIQEFRVATIGPIRQELLSGIQDENNFEILKEKLRPFEDIPIETEHYELAARLFNICRKNGIQGSHTDYLICAVSLANNYPIFTDDKDFERYQKYTGIKLHKI
jgi:predicted nucleic acid-binding protein